MKGELSRKKHKQKGFSLVELMIVITIGALVTVMALSQYTKTPSLQAAAKKVAMDIRYARGLAMTQATTHGIRFVNAGSYFVYKSTPATVVKDPATQQDYSEDLSDFRVGIGTTIDFEFNQYGKPSLNGGQTVNVSSGADNVQIRVVSNTGFVEIL